MAQQEQTKAINDDTKLKVGDRVIVDNDKKGQIKWIGEHKVLGLGTWYGVRLVEKRGDCNGTWKDNKFFYCPHGHGIIVQKKRIKNLYLKNDFDFMNEKEIKNDDTTKAIMENRLKLSKLKSKFRDMDKDGNKLVDVNEFGKIVKDAFSNLTNNEVKKLFEEVDVSKSGSISYAEFDSWIKKLGGLSVLEHKDFIDIRNKFKAMDKDGDQKISRDEFVNVCCELFPFILSKDSAKLFDEIDISKDGNIQFNEFDQWVKKQQ